MTHSDYGVVNISLQAEDLLRCRTGKGRTSFFSLIIWLGREINK